MKAKSLLQTEQVRVSHMKFDPDRPFLSFTIGEVLVQYNHKGWSSDWVEDDEAYSRRCAKAKREGNEAPMRWSSSYLTKTEDYHILACKMWLKDYLPKLAFLYGARQCDVEKIVQDALQAFSFTRG